MKTSYHEEQQYSRERDKRISDLGGVLEKQRKTIRELLQKGNVKNEKYFKNGNIESVRRS